MPITTENITAEHWDALGKAKILMMSRPDSAFFTTICFSLRHVWDRSIPTAATDGKTNYYNPEAYLALTLGQRLSRMLHETLHVALLHFIRMGSRCPQTWNAACDYYINGLLIDRGFERIITWLYDPKYQGMSSEQIYDELIAAGGKPMPEDQQDLLPPMDGDLEAMQNAVQDILIRAQLQSQMADDKPGTIPGDIELFLAKLLAPKLPWNRIFQKWLQKFAKTDYTWRRPRKRYMPMIMPSMYGHSLIDLAIAVDISGSVSDAEFLRIITEVASILRMMKPEKITLIQFDTEIKSVDVIKNLRDLMQVKFTGRGGTEINPVLNWANENKPQGLVIFTDGGFDWRGLETKADTFWLIHGNPKFTAPFGRVVHYSMKD